MSDQSITSWVRQPASIILIIALAIMIVMFIDQSQKKPGPASPPVSANNNSTPAAPLKKMPAPTAMALPGPVGGEMPKIVQSMGGPSPAAPTTKSMPGQLSAPDLGSLLGRMEDKVKSDPENIDNRLLLAQTYNELGLPDKAIAESRIAVKKQPDHLRAKLVLASVLSNRKEESELKEAVGILKGLKGNSDIKQYLVDMYLGDAWIRLGDHKAAVNSWKLALSGMPVSDNRRAKLESNIANISTNKDGT